MSASTGKEYLLNAVAQSDINMAGFKLTNFDTSNLNISLPSQTSNNGKFLTTNGTTTSWAAAVTSVGLSTDSGWFTIASSPITGSGTITINKTTGLAQNLVLATPSGLTGTVSARALVALDIPSLDASKITTGTLAVAQGGTNIASYAVGDMPFASGATALSKLAAVATGNVIISGGVTTAPSWGKVTSAHADTSLLKSSNNLSDVAVVATARNTILPAQTSNSGKYLTTDGTNATWASVAGSGSFTSFIFTNGGGFVGTVATATSSPTLSLTLGDNSDVTKTATLDCSNIATSTNRVINVPNANSTTAQTKAGVSHNFLTAMSAQGVFTAAQPVVADVSDYNASIAPAFTILSDGATITWTMNPALTVQNAKVTLGGNRTLAFASAAEGMSGVLIVVQDGSGSRQLILPAGSKVVNNGSGAVTLTSAASGVDILGWVKGPSSIYWTVLSNFS
jgi:hypothetical protein